MSIDSMSIEELHAQCDALEVDYKDGTPVATLRKMIKKALGEDDVPKTKATNAPTVKGQGTKRYKLVIGTDSRDKNDVFIGVNGRSYLIKRGVEVEVPEGVISVLKGAMAEILDPKTKEINKVQRYPFTATLIG